MKRVVYYTSGLSHCGVASYQGHVAGAWGQDTTLETVRLTAGRVPAGDLPAIAAKRAEWWRLAGLSAGAAGVLVDYSDSFFNGARPGENLFPGFVRRLSRAPVVVLHEWPGRSDPPDAAGSYLERGLARARNLGRAARDGRSPFYERSLRRRPFARAAHVVAHAEALADPARVGLPAARVHALPAPAYAPAGPALSRDQVEARFGLAGKRVVALVGVPQESKGFDRAVAALAHLPADVVLLQVGEVARGAAAGAELEARGAGRYRRTGPLTEGEFAAALARADAACAPFRRVNHSSSLGHLIGAGVPTVVSGVPGVAEVVAAGAGLIAVDCDDPAALAAALVEAMGPARERLVAMQRDTAARHSFAAVARKLCELAVSP